MAMRVTAGKGRERRTFVIEGPPYPPVKVGSELTMPNLSSMIVTKVEMIAGPLLEIDELRKQLQRVIAERDWLLFAIRPEEYKTIEAQLVAISEEPSANPSR